MEIRSAKSPPNPPTLAERLDSANKEVTDASAAARPQESRGPLKLRPDPKKSKPHGAHDQTSPAFQFVAATRQARRPDWKAAEKAKKHWRNSKPPRGKSGELAAAESETAKLQTALDKTDKFSEPYKQLAKQQEGAAKKVVATSAKATEAAKALADKSAAINAAAVELATKISAAPPRSR